MSSVPACPSGGSSWRRIRCRPAISTPSCPPEPASASPAIAAPQARRHHIDRPRSRNPGRLCGARRGLHRRSRPRTTSAVFRRRRAGQRLTVVCIDNDGAIFSMLPIHGRIDALTTDDLPHTPWRRPCATPGTRWHQCHRRRCGRRSSGRASGRQRQDRARCRSRDRAHRPGSRHGRASLHHDRRGCGDLRVSVVILHGFTGDGSTMRALADLVDPAALVPDLAGHGAGPHSTDPADYTVDAMADGVGARRPTVRPRRLLDGGRVALTAACRHPERVRSLTLIGASAGLADPDERRARASADDELAELIERDLPAFVERWMANPLLPLSPGSATTTSRALGRNVWATTPLRSPPASARRARDG